MHPEFNLPRRVTKITVVTPMMREMINRTLAVHTLSALILWYGQSRIGKTTTALYLSEELNRLFDESNPDSFRAVHYEVGKIGSRNGNEWKQGIRGFYEATHKSQIDEGFYKRNTPEAIARQVVHGLRRRRIELVFVDEAGTLSLEAIRGICLIRDTAVNEGWTLTVVFIGMDDLPDKLIKIPRIHLRLLDTCHFTKYEVNDTWELLKKLHTYFKNLDPKNKAHQEQVETVHELCSGLPGLIVPFVHKLSYRLQTLTGDVSVPFLRAVHELSNESMVNALKESRRVYRPYQVVPSTQVNEGGGAGRTTAKSSKRKQ
jgi:DNA transposition AAA+ family ATPase